MDTAALASRPLPGNVTVAPGFPSLAYVVNSLNPGGTEKLVVEMARAFQGEFEVKVYCLDEPGLWAKQLRREGIRVQCMWRQPGLDLGVALRLAGEFQRAGISIVHAHQCTAWFYSALARLRCPAPRLLLEEHGRFYPEVDKPLRRFVNRLLIARLTHGVVAVSDDIRKRLVRYEGLHRDKVDVIYNGVIPRSIPDPGERDRMRRQLGFGPADFVVGTVGRFDPIKNLPLLVQALANAAVERPAFRGLLVGDGPEAPRIRQLLVEAGLQDRVRLTGFRDDAALLTQCMDLFVLPSLSEGTSMALLEAMSSGVPVAVTAVGGNPEIVVGGESGWVVPSGDVGALTGALKEAESAPESCTAFANAARRRFQEQFTFAAMIERYRDVYRRLLVGPWKRRGKP